MALLKSAVERLKNSIRDVRDFPKKGVVFKDITPILQDAQLFRLAVTVIADRYQRRQVDQIVAIDARGFLFASAVAYVLGCGVSIVRKKGKLPYKTVEASYDLEYGSSTVQMHVDAIKPGQQVIIIDDVLATGGTMKAAIDLVERLGGKVTEVACLIELKFLHGAQRIAPVPVFSVIQY
jgi:adenine phosphoribosyltransferase